MSRFISGLKLKPRLLLSFLLIALIGAVVGAVGGLSLKRLDAADTFMFEKCTVPLGQMSTIIGNGTVGSKLGNKRVCCSYMRAFFSLG